MNASDSSRSTCTWSKRRVADVAVGIGETQLECFEYQVFGFGNVASKNSSHVVSLQDTQSHQHDKSLPVGWHFHDAVASVSGGDGIHPFRVLAREIGQLQITAAGIGSRDDFARQLTRVIIITSMLAELTPGPGQIALVKNFTWLGRLALQQIFLNRMIGHPQFGCAPFPYVGNFLSNRKTFLRIGGRGLDKIRELL